MGLLQKACETYDAHCHLAGEVVEGKQTLPPISHMLVSPKILITIDQEGKFQEAREIDKKEPKVVIPVTEESMGRTSAPCPHPLCDQIAYLADYDTKKRKLYEKQLMDWEQSEYSHPKLTAILKYIQGNTILEDMKKTGCMKFSDNGRPKDDKTLIAWSVIGLGLKSGPTYSDRELMDAFIKYYKNTRKNSVDLCQISGTYEAIAQQHAKGIIPLNGNAKLISANDKSNFTYLGRFIDDRQAATIGYEASQKAHNVLSWLAGNQSVSVNRGNRTFICWNPQGKPMPKIDSPLRKRNTENKATPSDYKEQLYKTIMSFRKEGQLSGNESAIIAVFDAATTGRLSLTYYKELSASDFMERLRIWDETCCWYDNRYGVESPSLLQIIECSLGSERDDGSLHVDDRIKAQQMQRLISCRIEKDGVAFPTDLMQAIVNRASNPMAYKKPMAYNSVYRKVLFTACAVIKKYRYDKYKEEWDMALEPHRKNRSYQYGRLLAVMEKVEWDVLKGKDDRETNAIRMQTVFSKRPEYASRIIMEQLKQAYFPRLTASLKTYYEKLFGDIFEELSVFTEEEMNQPLEDTYLMGYYLQKNELFKSKKEENEEEQ